MRAQIEAASRAAGVAVARGGVERACIMCVPVWLNVQQAQHDVNQLSEQSTSARRLVTARADETLPRRFVRTDPF